MILKTKLFGKVYQFNSVKEVMAKANEKKSGDELAGVAAQSAEERVAAKVVLGLEIAITWIAVLICAIGGIFGALIIIVLNYLKLAFV